MPAAERSFPSAGQRAALMVKLSTTRLTARSLPLKRVNPTSELFLKTERLPTRANLFLHRLPLQNKDSKYTKERRIPQ